MESLTERLVGNRKVPLPPFLQPVETVHYKDSQPTERWSYDPNEGMLSPVHPYPAGATHHYPIARSRPPLPPARLDDMLADPHYRFTPEIPEDSVFLPHDREYGTLFSGKRDYPSLRLSELVAADPEMLPNQDMQHIAQYLPLIIRLLQHYTQKNEGKPFTIDDIPFTIFSPEEAALFGQGNETGVYGPFLKAGGLKQSLSDREGIYAMAHELYHEFERTSGKMAEYLQRYGRHARDKLEEEADRAAMTITAWALPYLSNITREDRRELL